MKTFKKIFNCFEVYQINKLVLMGSIALIIGSLTGYLCHARFDGIIDVHFSDEVDYWMPFMDNIINVLSLGVIFLIIGKIINKKTRIVDVLTLGLVARIPIYFIALTNINNFNYNAAKQMVDLAQNSLTSIETSSLVLVIVFALISILLIACFGALLYKGFKTIAHANGRNAVMGVVIGLILAEGLSKFLFYFLF